MKICSKCTIPETAETLVFDEAGACSVCNQIDYKNKIDWKKRYNDLDKLINKHSKNTRYDCIVPFSGGKDSTFALWFLVKKKKLNPLVVRFDHNFLRETVEKNTEKTLKNLGVDFINFKPNFTLVKKMMLESLIRRGDFCWHCHVGITAYPINTAIKRNIKLLFYGEPTAEYSSFYDYSELEELNVEKFNKSANLGINAQDMLEMINERYPDEKVKLNELEEYIFPTQREINLNGIKAVYLGNYIKWDVKEQVRIIKKELNWEGDVVEGIPESYDYEKIECMMQGVRDYIKYIKRGFGRTSHLTSIDIRNNRLERKEAMELVKLYDGKRPHALDIFLKILKISEDEFYDIVENHLVYPNVKRNRNDLKTNKSNIKPKDFDNWSKKFT